MYDEFEKHEDFGVHSILQALRSEQSNQDKNQILEFYKKICSEVRAALRASGEDPEFAKLSRLWKENPENFEQCLQLANRAAELQKYELALELLLSIISKDKNWSDGAAVARIKSLFEEIGPGKPYVLKARKELSFWLH